MSEKLDLDAIEAMCEAGQRPPEVSLGEHDGVEWAASWHNEAYADVLEQAPDLIPALVARVRELEADIDAIKETFGTSGDWLSQVVKIGLIVGDEVR